MKNLKRSDQTYKLYNLPEIVGAKFAYNTINGFTGSIFRRPLKKVSALWHYAFFYGFDKNNNLLFIENNDDGIECVTWKDFLAGETSFEITHLEKDSSRSLEIMKRAHERRLDIYLGHDNNCEHFVNYCVHNKHESVQAESIKRIADAFLSFVEIQFALHPDRLVNEALHSLNDLRDTFNLDRKYEPLQEIIDKKLAGSKHIPIKEKISLPEIKNIKKPLN